MQEKMTLANFSATLSSMAVNNVSTRLIEQRVRNRIMEALWDLSLGDEGVVETGPTEWFESFFDWFPFYGQSDEYPAMTLQEVSAVQPVVKLMQQAIADSNIPESPTIEEVTRTGWPARIAPVARFALQVMRDRGRFSEETEEAEPSTSIDWDPGC